MATHIDVQDDIPNCVRVAADRVARRLSDAVRLRGRASWAITGGATPRPLYAMLARPSYQSRIPWGAIDVFVGDERMVPQFHPDSNFGQARRLLFSHVDVVPNKLHSIPVCLPPDEAARQYARTVQDLVPLGPRGVPVFDQILLGLGDDGHIASLFPGAPTVAERDRLVIAAAATSTHPHERVTMTAPLLLSAREVLVLVTGPAKREAVARAWRAGSAEEVPARLLKDAQGEVVWMLDRSADPSEAVRPEA